MTFIRTKKNANSLILMLCGVLFLSSCQTNNTDTAENTVTPAVQQPAKTIKQKPLDETLDPTIWKTTLLHLIECKSGEFK